MKQILLLVSCCWFLTFSYAQSAHPNEQQQKTITAVIDKYATARETKDTVLLKSILTEDIDQLVSTGEWRNGINTAVEGMLKSSATNPGTRTLHVEKIKMINEKTAIVDCRYEIKNNDGSLRKMWSTFILVENSNTWKITAIRNMLPAAQ